jgi:hypothetical protein
MYATSGSGRVMKSRTSRTAPQAVNLAEVAKVGGGVMAQRPFKPDDRAGTQSDRSAEPASRLHFPIKLHRFLLPQPARRHRANIVSLPITFKLLSNQRGLTP